MGGSEEDANNIALTMHVRLVDAVQKQSLIPSKSTLGGRILTLGASDAVAAKVSVGLATGRNLTRLTGEFQKQLYRVMPRLQYGLTSESAERGEKRVQDAALNVERVLKKSGQELESIQGVVKTAQESFDKQLAEIKVRLASAIGDATETAADQIRSIREEWEKEQAFYKTRTAFKETSAYWSGQRLTSLGVAIFWALVALALASYSLVGFIPNAVDQLELVRTEAAAVLLSKSGASIILIALPELVEIAVTGFLLLWGLRFSAKQVAENIFRIEDAGLRKTMLDTYLALVYPKDGKASLVTEADRALIIQALFRPSAAGNVDDAPPSHWIEDVLARFKNDKK